MLILYTTVHLLKNLARHEAMGLGLAISWDGTWRTVATGQPCFFVGTNDIDQHFHLVAGGIIDSENKIQCKEVLDTLLKFANRIRVREDVNAGVREPSPVLSPRYVIADNSDALQAAAEGVDATPVQCKVHLIRNAKEKAGVIATPTKPRKGAVKDLQADLERLAENTFHSGVSVDYSEGTIAKFLLELFTRKHVANQEAYIRKFRDEYTGARKGAWQAAFTNPAIPVHNNGIEAFNKQFKTDGKYPFLIWPLSFRPLCRLFHSNTPQARKNVTFNYRHGPHAALHQRRRRDHRRIELVH